MVIKKSKLLWWIETDNYIRIYFKNQPIYDACIAWEPVDSVRHRAELAWIRFGG